MEGAYMLKEVLNWLHDENNRAIVVMVGSVVAFLWTVGFAVYIRVQDQKPKGEEPARQRLPNERSNAKRRPPPKSVFTKQLAPLLLWAFGIFGIGALAYVWKFSENTITSEFIVCSGEYERECPAHNVYIYCYVDPETEVRKACKRYSVKTTQTKPGNKCGYSWTTFLCTNDAP
jgi:hypothetical protein